MKKVLLCLVIAIMASTNLLANDKTIVVNVEVDWGNENIQEIYEILQNHVEITLVEETILEETIEVLNLMGIEANIVQIFPIMKILEEKFLIEIIKMHQN